VGNLLCIHARKLSRRAAPCTQLCVQQNLLHRFLQRSPSTVVAAIGAQSA